MSAKNKFGFDAVDSTQPVRRDRRPGPMGAAVRETAETVQESARAKVEQRRRNAEDAKAWREASEQGRVLAELPVSVIGTDALPRDRIELDRVAASEEMEELKASIRARGQREPIEVWVEGDGYQLKKGWRRLTALRQLSEETGDPTYGRVVARIEASAEDRLSRYVDMVEENVVRENLTFAEMAQVAISAAEDAGVDEIDPDALVGRLYGSLHKTKRSYIRAFVWMLSILGPSLRWPKAVGRDLGVSVARAIKDPAVVDALRDELGRAGDAEAQNRLLTGFVASVSAKGQGAASAEAEPKSKLEFRVGTLKVTAREGEFRIMGTDNFAAIPRDRLEAATRAFEAELRRPKVRQL